MCFQKLYVLSYVYIALNATVSSIRACCLVTTGVVLAAILILWTSLANLVTHFKIEYPYMKYVGLILSFRPANERRRYKVTPSLVGWTQA